MIKDARAAHRYSAALFGIALRDGLVETIAKDLDVVERFVRDVPYFRSVILQPQIEEDRKIHLLSEAFGERVTATTLNFLYLIVRKRREVLLDEMIAEYRRLAEEHVGSVSALITSAIPLSDSQIAAVSAALSTKTGKQVKIETEVDPSLIAGILIRIGDEVIDGSVKFRIEKLRQRLLGTV